MSLLPCAESDPTLVPALTSPVTTDIETVAQQTDENFDIQDPMTRKYLEQTLLAGLEQLEV